jgi:preprotein translocase subunit SecF
MKKNLRIIENTKIWFLISGVIITIGIVAFIIHGGLNQGIDFKGGTMIEMSIGNNFNVEDVRSIAKTYDKDIQVQMVGTDGVTLRSSVLSDSQQNDLVNAIVAKYKLVKKDALKDSQRIGPSVGNELKQSSFLAGALSIIAILIFVTIRFEFRSGVSAVIALVHDLLVTLSVYAVVQIPINSSFIAAILTILGYSMSDTIVVFDRIRENKKLGRSKDYADLVDTSITQTLTRSINTVLTVLITITSLYIFGVQAVRDFALPLIIGIVSGCYSSIFIASPIWVIWMKSDKKEKLA